MWGSGFIIQEMTHLHADKRVPMDTDIDIEETSNAQTD